MCSLLPAPCDSTPGNDQITLSLFPIDLIRDALKLDKEIQELARGLYQQKSLIVMGRGFNYATCLEGALVCDKPLIKEFSTDEFAQANSVPYEGNV